ncbi:MAG: hypothetical protein IPK23_09405 [Rhizobiales bacterium]|nr:hypothetical protein [Hyphomicrobiales bacterium]
MDIESRSIDQIIEEGLRQEELSLNRHIKRVALDIDKVITANEPQAAMLDRVRRLILGEEPDAVADRPSNSFAYALATIVAFSELVDVSFYAMG